MFTLIIFNSNAVTSDAAAGFARHGGRAGPNSAPARLHRQFGAGHEWEPRQIFVIVSIYIDESGTHGSPVVIMGGWVGRLGQWTTFDKKWRPFLKRHSLTYFHSKELKHNENEFKGWTIQRKHIFMAEVSKLAQKNMTFGFVVRVNIDEYKKYYIGKSRLQGVALDSPFGLCFRHTFGVVTSLAIQHFHDKALDVHFVLESGHKILGNAETIFHNVKKPDNSRPEEQAIKAILRTISRGDKKECPGLQIADVCAYSGFQYNMAGNSPIEIVSLPNMTAMAEAKKLQRTPIFYVPITEHELAQYRQKLLDRLDEKRLRGVAHNCKPPPLE
jgi:Protein of unknown function (DUF3800)